MAVLSFPDPTLEQTYFANGINYSWDGQKWTASSETGEYVLTAGDTMTGSVNVPERVITTSAFDLSTGPYWTCGAIDVPNPTNAAAGMGGLIRLSAEPTSWGDNFHFSGGVAPTGSGMIPFYVESASYIVLGNVTAGDW